MKPCGLFRDLCRNLDRAEDEMRYLCGFLGKIGSCQCDGKSQHHGKRSGKKPVEHCRDKHPGRGCCEEKCEKHEK